ncbi:GntR family transcriptional regulator [Pantoea sp. EA-12]|uniref:GntR family transcriptional regulator n=1 Tax=Pantoea sp. EA-12 TaxID=3043303 RepID=UPI0024B48A75|nr:GntR family transcriptional regulator [Pantoea sp. EA-12]MDI9221061.1 GntR family transcriptional regulator [Pantoea sp. EA-12]
MSANLTLKQKEVTRIVASLTMAIAQHKLRPGTRLIEAQIVEALEANRNHVQAALQRMVLQQIVTIEPNIGAAVAQPSARTAREIFIARHAIESAIIACITPEKMQAYRAQLQKQQHNEHEAIHQQERRRIVYELGEFHLLLGKVCGNEVLENILNNLMVLSSLIVMLYQRNEAPICQCDEHQQIIRELEAGNTQRAQLLMREHLVELEQQLDISEASPNAMTLTQALAQDESRKLQVE